MNGNLISDAEGRNFTFNGDNKQSEIRNGTTLLAGYYYDGEGKRVKKKVYNPTETVKEETVFVYDGLGKLIAEYSTVDPPPNPTTSYTATDQLGSPRVITNSNGEVVSRRDFMPFGEELANDPNYRTAALKYNTGDGIRQKFTGYQKDEETNLDFAEARMYENRHARFTAVDPLLASGKSANPQTFNRYVYVGNNPLAYTDPTGLQTTSNPNDEYEVYDCDSSRQQCSGSISEDRSSITYNEPVGSTDITWAEQFIQRPIRDFFRQLIDAPYGLGDVAESSENNNRSNTGGLFYEPGGSRQLVRDGFSNFAEGNRQLNDGIEMIDPTGLAVFNRTSVMASFGKASNTDVALSGGNFLFNTGSMFFGGGTTRKGIQSSAEVVLAESGDDLVRVGRWMENGEFMQMMKTGIVQESKTGTSHVVFPASPMGFMKQARTGAMYVEFNVPASSLRMTNRELGWAKIVGPNSLEGRNAARFGRPTPQMPSASNVFCYVCRTNIP